MSFGLRHAPHLLDLDTVTYEAVAPGRVSVDVVHTVDQLNLKTQSGGWPHRVGTKTLSVFVLCSDQVVEGGALLPPAHMFEETMIGHQQQSAGVLPVIRDLTLPPEHRLWPGKQR